VTRIDLSSSAKGESPCIAQTPQAATVRRLVVDIRNYVGHVAGRADFAMSITHQHVLLASITLQV
jgi:hypothetical protein